MWNGVWYEVLICIYISYNLCVYIFVYSNLCYRIIKSKIYLRIGVPLPIEIYPSNFEATRQALESLPFCHHQGCRAYLRTGTIGYRAHDGDIKAVTDNGNFIVDLYFSKPIQDPVQALKELNDTKGVFCHGLFVNDQTRTVNLIVGNRKGVDVFTNKSRPFYWWSEIKTKQGLEKQALDNRIPVSSADQIWEIKIKWNEIRGPLCKYTLTK